jgi:spore coat polysaccharide biosynthesis predicted glycosyltransferase SpsG
MLPDLYILADDKCGLGHVRRQQVLEAKWKNAGGEVYWHQPTRPGILVIDDYYYPNADRLIWMGLNNLVVYFTEFEGVFDCDVVVNQNIGAEELNYPNSKLKLLGTQYFLLRDHYKNIRPTGGEAIFDADKVDRKLEPLEFARCLASSRAVICSAGLTAYESIYLQKPTFIRLSAENQQRTYDRLISGGWAFPYDDTRASMLNYGWLPEVKDGKNLIDGYGADLVAWNLYTLWEKTHAATEENHAYFRLHGNK